MGGGAPRAALPEGLRLARQEPGSPPRGAGAEPLARELPRAAITVEPLDPPGWKLDNASITALRTALGRSLQNYMWSTMLPVPGRILPCSRRPPSHAIYGLAEIATNWPVAIDTDQPGFEFELEPVFPTLINFVTVEVLDTPTANLLFSKPTASNPNRLGLEQPYFFGGAWIANGRPSTPGFRYLNARSYSDICTL